METALPSLCFYSSAEGERKINSPFKSNILEIAPVVSGSNINIHYYYLRTVFTFLTRVLEQNMLKHSCLWITELQKYV